jgi:hypothetical protein
VTDKQTGTIGRSGEKKRGERDRERERGREREREREREGLTDKQAERRKDRIRNKLTYFMNNDNN